MRIFANQRLEDLIVVITPVIDGTGINVFVQFFPVRVMATLGPHFSTIAAVAEFCVAVAT